MRQVTILLLSIAVYLIFCSVSTAKFYDDLEEELLNDGILLIIIIILV